MTLTSDSPASVVSSRALSLALGQDQAYQRVIVGTGFGQGPNVVLFDRFDGENFEVVSPNRQADIGVWDGYGFIAGQEASFTPKLYQYGGRTWLSIREADKIASSTKHPVALDKIFPAAKEFRLAHRQFVPPGFNFPGATTHGPMGDSSSYKMVWVAGEDVTGSFGPTDGKADICIPTHMGGGSISFGGNSIHPRKPDGFTGFYSDHVVGVQNLHGWYQSGDESSDGAYDATIEVVLSNQNGFVRDVYLGDTYKPNGEDPPTKDYSGLRVPGWFGNSADYVNTLALVGDIYLAVGPNSRACIITGNAPTLAACSESYIIAPDSWADTEIKYTPKGREDLPYTHLILADGTLRENV